MRRAPSILAHSVLSSTLGSVLGAENGASPLSTPTTCSACVPRMATSASCTVSGSQNIHQRPRPGLQGRFVCVSSYTQLLGGRGRCACVRVLFHGRKSLVAPQNELCDTKTRRSNSDENIVCIENIVVKIFVPAPSQPRVSSQRRVALELNGPPPGTHPLDCWF